jgi:hypothetical protein
VRLDSKRSGSTRLLFCTAGVLLRYTQASPSPSPSPVCRRSACTSFNARLCRRLQSDPVLASVACVVRLDRGLRRAHDIDTDLRLGSIYTLIALFTERETETLLLLCDFAVNRNPNYPNKVLDEVHERTLEADFLLILCKTVIV